MRLPKQDATPLPSGPGVDQTVVDELQISINLLNAFKITVDSHPDKYHFVLSDRTNILLVKKVSEPLAGRAGGAIALEPIAKTVSMSLKILLEDDFYASNGGYSRFLSIMETWWVLSRRSLVVETGLCLRKPS